MISATDQSRTRLRLTRASAISQRLARCSWLSSLRCLGLPLGQRSVELCAMKSVICQQAELDFSVGSGRLPCGETRNWTRSLPLHSVGQGKSGGQPRGREIGSTSRWKKPRSYYRGTRCRGRTGAIFTIRLSQIWGRLSDFAE